MACTASSGCSKVTVPIPRLLPSLSSFTSARFTTPAMLNTSFNFFQPTLKSNCKNNRKTPLLLINMLNHCWLDLEVAHYNILTLATNTVVPSRPACSAWMTSGGMLGLLAMEGGRFIPPGPMSCPRPPC